MKCQTVSQFNEKGVRFHRMFCKSKWSLLYRFWSHNFLSKSKSISALIWQINHKSLKYNNEVLFTILKLRWPEIANNNRIYDDWSEKAIYVEKTWQKVLFSLKTNVNTLQYNGLTSKGRKTELKKNCRVKNFEANFYKRKNLLHLDK